MNDMLSGKMENHDISTGCRGLERGYPPSSDGSVLATSALSLLERPFQVPVEVKDFWFRLRGQKLILFRDLRGSSVMSSGLLRNKGEGSSIVLHNETR